MLFLIISFNLSMIASCFVCKIITNFTFIYYINCHKTFIFFGIVAFYGNIYNLLKFRK